MAVRGYVAGRGKGWDLLLALGFGAMGVGGLVLVLAPDSLVVAWLNGAIARVFGGSGAGGAESLRRWLFAVEGSTLVAFGVLGLGVARTAFLRRERWARNALAGAIAVWFPLDTAASLAYGMWPNAVLNVGIAVLLALPLAALWREFGGAGDRGVRIRAEQAPPEAVVSWEPPSPRPGWRGGVDRFFGPGATVGEYVVQAVAVVVLSAMMVAMAAASPALAGLGVLGWSVLVVLAVDIAGGVVTNATAPAKRWYHRRELGFEEQLAFVGLHGLHLVLFTLVLGGLTWLQCTLFYGLLMATTVLLLRVPLHLQRPVALSTYAAVLLVALTVVPPETGLAWFLPLFFLKLEVSHLVREAPFRPVRPGRGRWPGRAGSGGRGGAVLLVLALAACSFPGRVAGQVSAPDRASDAGVLTGHWDFVWTRIREEGARLTGGGLGFQVAPGTTVGVAGYGTARAARLPPDVELHLSFGGLTVERQLWRRGPWRAVAAALVGGGTLRIDDRGIGAERSATVAVVRPELRLGVALGHLTVSGGLAYRWVGGADGLGLSDADARGVGAVVRLGVR